MRRPSRYGEGEVRALVEAYAEKREQRDTTRRGIRYLIDLADLDRALKQLSLRLWEVVLLHGLLGIPQVATAELLQVSQQAVSKRYRQALEEIHYLINGGT